MLRKKYFNRSTYLHFILGFRNPSTADKTWNPFDASEVNYLHITSTQDEMRKGLLMDRLSFWKNILSSNSDMLWTEKSRDEL